MKKLTVLITIILSVLLLSCGSKTGKKASSQTSNKDEISSLYTREGMMNLLKDLKIEIPEVLQFDTVSGKEIHFKAKNIDAAARLKLNEYYNKLREDLKAAGWNESEEIDNNKNFGGIIKMAYRYKIPLADGKSSKILVISTDYFESNGDFAFNIAYFPKN